MAIKACTCKNDYQDERYGKGMRVHTVRPPDKAPRYRCTVCLKERGD